MDIDTFASVAFDFVLGHAERVLHNQFEMSHQRFEYGPGGEIIPGEPFPKTERTKRLEIAISVLHELIRGWNEE